MNRKTRKIFVKRCPNRELFLLELRNSIEAYNISKKTSVLDTPAIISYNEQKNVINFELLENAISVLKILRSYNYLKMERGYLLELFYDIGVALAEYHIYSEKLHGDFFPANILIKPGQASKIYFIDFSCPIEIKDSHYNRGSIFKDLALFAVCLKLKYPVYLFPLAFRKFNEQLCQAFFKGYVHHSQITFDNRAFALQIENTKLLPTLKNTFVIKFLDWLPFLKIRGYKHEI